MDLDKFQKERKEINQIKSENENLSVVLGGWLYDSRDLGKIRFAVIRDLSGDIQVTAHKDKVDTVLFDKMIKTNRESVVIVSGIVKKSDKAPGGREIIPESFEVVSEAADPLPIDVSDFSKTEMPKRIDYRFLDLHRKRTRAIFKIQHTMMQAFREFMINERAIECQFPGIIGSSSEGGTDVFEVKYFEKKAYLSQSCQLYKQMLACSMEKVFAIFQTWRAEKHNTTRHLNESRQFDFEMAFADEFIVMNILGRTVQSIVEKIKKDNQGELDLLGIDLKVPEMKYLTFKEANELLEKNGIEVNNTDLTGESERKLGEIYPDTIVFVHDWPIEGKTFYIMPKEDGLSRGFDAIYNGLEISSGGQRIHSPDLLIERLKENGLNPDDFEGYIDSFRYGAPPHAGWGLGLERLTMVLLGLDNIREAVLFPRDRDKITP